MIHYEFLPFTTDLDESFDRLAATAGFGGSSRHLKSAICPHGAWAAVGRDPNRDGSIIGMGGIIPAALRAGDALVPGFQAIDFVVDPRYRASGVFTSLGTTLLDGAKSLGAHVVWMFAHESADEACFDHLGWAKLGPVPYMMRLLRSGVFLKRLFPLLGRLDFPLLAKPKPVLRLREIERFGPDADHLWSSFSAQVGCAVERDSSWLNWRVFDQPGRRYRTVGLFDEQGEMAAFVSSIVVNQFGAKVLYVVEALSWPEERYNLSAIIHHEVARAAHEGVGAALCWCPASSPSRGAFARAGFLSIPKRLPPMNSYQVVKPLTDTPAEVTSSDAWYVSFLDIDIFALTASSVLPPRTG